MAAGIILILNIVAISLAFEHLLGMTPQAAVIYATPLSIISSAVAIPSSAGLREQEKNLSYMNLRFPISWELWSLIMPFANLKPIKPLLVQSHWLLWDYKSRGYCRFPAHYLLLILSLTTH